MKPQRAFVAQRAAAQHCAELLPRRAPAASPLAGAQALGERLARALAPLLAGHYGGEEPEVLVLAAEDETTEGLLAAPRSLAAHGLFSLGAPGSLALASADGAAVLELLDRAFGGRGEAPAPLPQQFPPSAQLLLEALHAAIGTALGTALRADAAVTLLRQGADLAALEPFPVATALVTLRLQITPGMQRPWILRLSLPAATLAQGPVPQGTTTARTGRPGDPAAAPFAGIAVPLRAVLVDIAVPVGRLAELRPGQILPVAVARAVPLRAGGCTIAHGVVGNQDDRVALQITHLA